MSIPVAAILGTLLSANVGWLFMATTTGMYLIYEFMHFCCHVDENWFVRHCPFVNTLRRHHTAHHNARLMMEVNMNLTFPIADWLLGTSDLDRGLVGTLLNGYDTQHLKKHLRGAPRRPDEAAAAPVGRIDGFTAPRGAARFLVIELRAGAMPNDVKAAVSAITLIVAVVLAYGADRPFAMTSRPSSSAPRSS